MPGPDPIEEARRWLFAAEDLSAAATLLDSGDVPRHACWLAQQSSEKALKGGLVFFQIEYPRTHDLDVFRNLLPNPKRWKLPDLANLTQWAIEARYPGEWPEATLEDAQRAVQEARVVYESMTAELGARKVHAVSARDCRMPLLRESLILDSYRRKTACSVAS